jgi:hypothetical protein
MKAQVPGPPTAISSPGLLDAQVPGPPTAISSPGLLDDVRQIKQHSL